MKNFTERLIRATAVLVEMFTKEALCNVMQRVEMNLEANLIVVLVNALRFKAYFACYITAIRLS